MTDVDLSAEPTTSAATLVLAEVERHRCRVVLRDEVPRLVALPGGRLDSLPPALVAEVRRCRRPILAILGPSPRRRVVAVASGEVLWETAGKGTEEGLARLRAMSLERPGVALALEWRRAWYGGEEWVPFAWENHEATPCRS